MLFKKYMGDKTSQTMRDAFINAVYARMKKNRSIFFLSADLGAPALDRLKRDFKDRFINVGIAEQNLINVSTGLALEGYTVFAYGICPFITMRAYEQIRQSLSISSQIRSVNVNLIGLGAGLSYGLSGPSHHCLEDLSIMKLMPNFTIFSPSDWKLAEKFVNYSIDVHAPKYLRLDGAILPLIYEGMKDFNLKKGFYELSKGKKVCLVSTGFMTQVALKIIKSLSNIGLIDVFLLKPINERALFNALKHYKCIITLEEAFINNGGLDSLISKIFRDYRFDARLKNLGFSDKHVFKIGSRDYLHKLNGLDEASIKMIIQNLCRNMH